MQFQSLAANVGWIAVGATAGLILVFINIALFVWFLKFKRKKRGKKSLKIFTVCFQL